MRNNSILKTLLLICSAWLGASAVVAAPIEETGDEPLLKSLDGEVAPGALLVGKTRPEAIVRLDGRRLRVTPDGYFVFGFGRDAEGLVGLSLEAGERRASHVFRLRERDWPVQEIEGVPERTVEPPEGQTLKRIRQETAAVQAARARGSDLKHFLNSFRWPLHGRITGVYGSQRIYNGEPGRPHYGVDIARPTGTPVKSPNAGEVVLAHPNMFYSGGTLIIDHGYGVTSTFIHLKDLKVEKGDQVRKGQIVATVGSSGRATGPHLDWRINWYQTRIDPQTLVGDMIKRYRSASNTDGD